MLFAILNLSFSQEETFLKIKKKRIFGGDLFQFGVL